LRPRRPKNPLGVSSRRAKRKGVWGEGIFARLPSRKAGLGWERLSFVQKMFELRSAIATRILSKNLAHTAGFLVTKFSALSEKYSDESKDY